MNKTLTFFDFNRIATDYEQYNWLFRKLDASHQIKNELHQAIYNYNTLIVNPDNEISLLTSGNNFLPILFLKLIQVFNAFDFVRRLSLFTIFVPEKSITSLTVQ